MPTSMTSWRRGAFLWVALMLIAAGGFVLMGYSVWSAHQEIAGAAKSTAQTQVDRVDLRFEAALRKLDGGLDDLRHLLSAGNLNKDEAASHREGLELAMEQLRRRHPDVAGFRVIDAKGNVLYLAGGGEYVNLADRVYFRLMRDTPEMDSFISDFMDSRITGRRTLAVAKTIRSESGQFLGLVTAAIEMNYFERLFDAVNVGSQGAIAIYHAETHRLIARRPESVSREEQTLLPLHPVRLRVESGVQASVLESSEADGNPHVLAYRRLSNYPFYIVADLDPDDVMAVWRQRADMVGWVALFLFLGFLIVIAYMVRMQHLQAEAMAALERNRQQLRDAQRMARVGNWEYDPKNDRISCSEEFFQIFEADPEHGLKNLADLMQFVHPEDRDLVEKGARQALRTGGTYQVEHRLLMADGRVKRIHSLGEAVVSESGEVLRLIGASQDITQLRQIESQMELLASAVQHSSEAIVITDHENNIIIVNEAFSRLTGYEKDEVIGKNPRILSAGRNTSSDYQAMWQSLDETGFWQGEVWDRRKDGEIYPKWLSISLIRDEEGAIRYHIGHFTDISEERAAEAKLHHMAHHDVLTGLYNRGSFKERLDHALALARRQNTRTALMFIDLDRFKVINDTLGHHVGDQLLIAVGRRLRESVRDSDVVARLGGDEFVVMLTGIEHTSAVSAIAEKLVSSIDEPYMVDGHQLFTSPSIGIAIYPLDGHDGETLMKNADAAMYHAKTAGRNNYQFFDAKMNTAALERLKIESNLRRALGNDEFRLHFQPIVDVASGRVAGVEALVRWLEPERGLLAPGAFIGVAEETGLIQPLGDWVFWAACRQLAELQAAGLGGVKMSINISALQMRSDALPVLARGAIEAYSLTPGDLIFEITETVAMQQPEETVRILDILHDMGVQLALDDFGTGYSSLNYLRMFALNHLKLDRSFVQEIGQDADGQVICDATIGLAHNLGLKLVAEGVETESQLDYLRQRGCDLVQGYYFSRPLPADQLIEFIRQRNA